MIRILYMVRAVKIIRTTGVLYIVLRASFPTTAATMFWFIFPIREYSITIIIIIIIIHICVVCNIIIIHRTKYMYSEPSCRSRYDAAVYSNNTLLLVYHYTDDEWQEDKTRGPAAMYFILFEFRSRYTTTATNSIM